MRKSIAGSMESMDCMVSVFERPSGTGITLSIGGSGSELFHSAIVNTVNRTLSAFNIQDIEVHIQDCGALEPVLSARLETALLRYSAASDEREP